MPTKKRKSGKALSQKNSKQARTNECTTAEQAPSVDLTALDNSGVQESLDDSDDETLRPGDVIGFDHPMFVQGTTLAKRQGTVLSTDPDDTYPARTDDWEAEHNVESYRFIKLKLKNIH
jgi:hypothetical protein